jgi:RHS repeat-associated protein
MLDPTVYLYDGDNVIEEVDSRGNILTRLTDSQNIDEPLSELSSGTVGYYQQDALGSITSLSNSAGALANTYKYDSFGNLSASTGTLTNTFRFTGRESDSETALRYYRARYYDPTVGRFMSEDPIRFDGGADFYTYVENDPTNFADPLGLYTIAPPKPGHPVTPLPSAALNKLLHCIEDRLHISLTVTSTTEGKHQDPGHAAGTSVDMLPPPGVSPNAVFCAAGQCGAGWGINEDTSHGGQRTPNTTGANYHVQLFPPHHPSPKAPDAIPPGCTPGPSCSNAK